MAEYVTCPACGSKVLTSEALLGRRIRCFGCGLRFVAAPDPPAPPAPEPQDKLEPAPPRIERDEDEDEDWPFCPGCGRRVTWHASVCPHCGEEFEEEEAPPRPLNLDVTVPVRRDLEPPRDRLLFTLGTISAVTGAFSACTLGWLAIISVPLGAVVWFLASHDLRRMADGSVDPRSRTRTRHARSAAGAGIAFGLLFTGLYLVFWLAG